ncbi:MAG: hypothetical protein AABO41_07005 [Acidobacteriota bacterium]
MINILSIKFGLAFAPYFVEAATEFLSEGAVASRVVRQAGSGLIIRPEGGVALRYQGRECFLGAEEVRHYRATVSFRVEVYDVKRLSDEVVISSVGQDILLSHPQSEVWLERVAARAMLGAFKDGELTSGERDQSDLPSWLSISSGSGRILLSDGRTGRWVLLGADHMTDIEPRLMTGESVSEQTTKQSPPTIALKGLSIHLQSAIKLAETLEQFAKTGKVAPFEEITSTYSLTATNSTEGIELTDSDARVALTARESRKWAGIVRGEIDRLKIAQVERGRIRTVFAEVDDGRWVLQWGDEILAARGRSLKSKIDDAESSTILEKQAGGFRLLLNRDTGACVALNDAELSHLLGQD